MLLRGGAFEGHGRGFLQFQWLGIDCDGRGGERSSEAVEELTEQVLLPWLVVGL